MTELVILRGLPGSGKSTKAKTEYPNHLHYEPDHLFCDTQGRYRFDAQLSADVHRFVHKMVDNALARGEDVVVSEVLPSLKCLRPYQRMAAQHQATLRVVDCHGQFGNVHHVPLYVLDSMSESWEPYAA